MDRMTPKILWEYTRIALVVAFGLWVLAMVTGCASVRLVELQDECGARKYPTQEGLDECLLAAEETYQYERIAAEGERIDAACAAILDCKARGGNPTTVDHGMRSRRIKCPDSDDYVPSRSTRWYCVSDDDLRDIMRGGY